AKVGTLLLHCNIQLSQRSRGADRVQQCDRTGKVPPMTARPSREPARRGRSSIFPAPGHDHTRCSSDAMAMAESICSERGQRLTQIRRQVLAALLASHKPLGAYEIIDRLTPRGLRPAPITAYRGVAFLPEDGLMHRIESRQASTSLLHHHAAGAPVVFPICV